MFLTCEYASVVFVRVSRAAAKIGRTTRGLAGRVAHVSVRGNRRVLERSGAGGTTRWRSFVYADMRKKGARVCSGHHYGWTYGGLRRDMCLLLRSVVRFLRGVCRQNQVLTVCVCATVVW